MIGNHASMSEEECQQWVALLAFPIDIHLLNGQPMMNLIDSHKVRQWEGFINDIIWGHR